MSSFTFSLRENYWETFDIKDEDIEFLYNFLLEKETPLTTRELVAALAEERIRVEQQLIEQQRSSGGTIYYPKDTYQESQTLVFPALNWQRGKVISIRPGNNPDIGPFQVIRVALENGEVKDFASGIENHVLNKPPALSESDQSLDLSYVLSHYGDDLEEYLEDHLRKNPDFVRIAGRWFPRALLVNINTGHLNLAEAVLDMAGGGPLPTSALLEQIGLTDTGNPKLTEFSLDLALQEDPRFDEVGPAGEVLWFLNRLEPEEVLKPHFCLRYSEIEYNPAVLTDSMLSLINELDDELKPASGKFDHLREVAVPLIYPHWRAGTFPLSGRVRHIFPTAYEAPRIRFMWVDEASGAKFPGWVVRPYRYVSGLRDWYRAKGVMPGSIIKVKAGKAPGEVMIHVETRRPSREWVRTVLVGSDGGVVFALLKQPVSTVYDERMTIAVPDPEALDQVWLQGQKDRLPFERVLVNTVRELAKLTPQSHVHATELYAAVNVVRRCPPDPILAVLASRPWFVHVGDLHFRFDDSERE